MIRSVLISDRMWFDQHPQAIVRFRRQRTEEFEALHNQGLQVPAFKPSFTTTNQENLTWVAVVDLLQLLQDSVERSEKTRARLRLRTIPLRNFHQRQQAREELIHAVAKELLELEHVRELPVEQSAS